MIFRLFIAILFLFFVVTTMAMLATNYGTFICFLIFFNLNLFLNSFFINQIKNKSNTA